MDSSLPKRKLIRLPEYDYGQNGMYFITLCTKDKQKIFGAIDESGKCVLSGCGEIVDAAIQNIANIYKFIKIDKYVIMPNHLHMILSIDTSASTFGSIATVINQFKGQSQNKPGIRFGKSHFMTI